MASFTNSGSYGVCIYSGFCNIRITAENIFKCLKLIVLIVYVQLMISLSLANVFIVGPVSKEQEKKQPILILVVNRVYSHINY